MTTPTTKKTTRKPRAKKTVAVEAPPAITSLPKLPFVFEVLELTSKQVGNANKVKALQAYEFDALNTTRREMMFINLLRKLQPREAEVLILTKDKDLGTKYNITIDNVKQAFPKMTWSK